MTRTTISSLALALVIACAALAACGEDRSDAHSGSGAATHTGGLDEGTGSGDADEGGDSENEAFDVAPGAEGGGEEGGEAMGCAKVDLLFVIDDSDSMEEDQASLIASFPGFVDGISEAVEIEDYHVGVITSDAYASNPMRCAVHGGLVTATHGGHSSEAVCGPFANGKNFMTAADDLDAEFSCTAHVGTSGDADEQPMTALTEALSPPLQAGCNAGFLRDDAVLVVVLITDEEDDYKMDPHYGNFTGSPGDPQTWFEAVAVSKQDNEQSVVVLSLVHPTEETCQQNGNAWELSARLIEFTELFTYGFVGDICAPSYDDYFQEALSVIDQACDGFVPPG